MMTDGPASRIEYLAVDRVPRYASINEVRLEFAGASDPWWHIEHRDDSAANANVEWIDYLTRDLSMWKAKVFTNLIIPWEEAVIFGKAGTNLAEVRLDHRQLPSGGSRDSNGIVFLDWDGNRWLATLPNIELPAIPQFILRRL
jgi:hypothetical protein